MADDTAALKELQARLNASFEAIYHAKDARSLADAKNSLVGLTQATAGVALGPVFSIVAFAGLPINYMAIKIALDLKIFDHFASKPQSLEELVKATKADARLLNRILRLITALGWIKQDAVDVWQSTPLSRLATVPAFRDWLTVHFDTRMQTYSEFPEWLRKHDYKTSWASDTDNIWLQENGEPVWEYMASHPEYGARFDSAMSMQDSLPPEMSPPYPFPDELKDTKVDGESVTLVDVGGGFGQTIDSIKTNYPDLGGKFILQDLPKSIDALDAARSQTAGFQAMSHDFFKEQPVKGAKYYHMRRILHDWNDEKCLEILAAARSAMDPAYSKLLVVDFVLPDLNAGLLESHLDLMMMTTCDGQERSESEWHQLLGKAGFRIDRILRPEVGTTSVIEASIV
ncbi:hypothetical protein NM208_g1767 [Fusarium decemcellulare]|uniref:Uncharacterized protein n=1 Tax=Fusarium decemcellulare TaxID=57161 RepID=A0ACC1SUS6_9HYPO|nr:hypothetical protein NM208_g1767 [Fusarium decemcellulare]